MLGNISPLQLLIVFLIVLLIFGTKKIRNIGGDLGSAIRDFRKGLSDSEKTQENTEESRSVENTESSDSGKPEPKA